jgi:hypothetical protein
LVRLDDALGFRAFEHLGDPHRPIADPLDATRRKQFDSAASHEELLVSSFRRGTRVYDPPPFAASTRRERQLALSIPASNVS